jgi:hypothetical protein
VNDILGELSIVRTWAEDGLHAFIAYLPNLLSAFAILFLGWLVARMTRGAVTRLFLWANRGLDRVFRRGHLASARISDGAAKVLSTIAYWLVLFVAVAIAARIAGFTAVSTWLDQIVTYLPNLIVGVTIIIVGYVVSVVVGEQVAAAARAARSGQSNVLGGLAQAIILISALIIGLDQLGVDVTFLVALFAVATGAVCIGFSLAFGFGAKDFVSDLVSTRDVNRVIKPGFTVRIGAYEGEVLEVTPTRLVIDTQQGRVLVPGRLAAADAIVILTSDKDGRFNEDA